VVKRASTAGSTPALLGTVADVCRLALTPPQGPVFLGVPMELLLTDEPIQPPRVLAPPPAPVQPTAADLDAVAAALVAAERPLILTEMAGRAPADVARLVALAETLGAPVCEAWSPVFLNFPRDHPLHQGYDARELLATADVVLLVACQAAWYPASARPPQAQVIALDPDPAHEQQPYWALGVDRVLAGTLGPALEGLLAAVRDRRPPADPRPAERLAHWRAAHERQRAAWTAAAREAADHQPIDPRWATYVLGQVLPEDAIVAEELTSERPFLLRYVPRTIPGTFQGRNHGGLGTSLSLALGLKFALRDQLVVNVLGDGAFHYNAAFPAFGFAQQWQTPVLHVVFNNQGYAAMKSAHQRYYPAGWAARTGIYPGSEIAPSPDYVAFAQAFGAHAERVIEPRALEAALTEAVRRVRDGQPALVEIVTRPGDLRR
jgi:acetolactate synthase-1/2/3 large subunit